MELDFTAKLFIIAIVLESTALHEMAHAYMATWLGDPTPGRYGRLTWNPIPHLDPVMTAIILPVLMFMTSQRLFCLATTPINPSRFKKPMRDHALVAVVGPLVNLLVMALLIGIAWIPGVWAVYQLNYATVVIFYAARINLILFLFNLIPIPPLDGYWIARGILPLELRMKTDALARSQISFILVLLVAPLILQQVMGPFERVFDWMLPHGY